MAFKYVPLLKQIKPRLEQLISILPKPDLITLPYSETEFIKRITSLLDTPVEKRPEYLAIKFIDTSFSFDEVVALQTLFFVGCLRNLDNYKNPLEAFKYHYEKCALKNKWEIVRYLVGENYFKLNLIRGKNVIYPYIEK